MPSDGNKHHILAMSEVKSATTEATTEATTNPLEERRLALEERKAQQDYEVKTLELSLDYVDWIARGAKPADLPVQQPPSSNWWSISRPRRRSASPFRRRCSPALMR